MQETLNSAQKCNADESKQLHEQEFGVRGRLLPGTGLPHVKMTTVTSCFCFCPSLPEKTTKILTEFLHFYEDQYGVALFNSMRHEIEGTGAPQAQLLWRKVRGAERGGVG